MTWTAITSIQPSNKWQFTNPIDGEFFRIKHIRPSRDPKAWICQAEKLEDGTAQIFDIQIIRGENLIEVFCLQKPAFFTNRWLGVKCDTNSLSKSSLLTSPWTVNLEISDVNNIIFQDSIILEKLSHIDSEQSLIQSNIAALLQSFIQQANSLVNIANQINAIKLLLDNFSATSTKPKTSTPATDSDFEKVVLLAHFDKDFSDIKGHTITPQGNTAISAVQSKFGGKSAYFDGDGDYLSIANDADNLGFTAENYTVEFFVYPLELKGLLLGKSGYYNQAYPTCEIYLSTQGKVGVGFSQPATSPARVYNNNLVLYISSTSTLTINAWHHISVVKSGNQVCLFVNGVLDGQGTLNFTPNDRRYSLVIGGGGGDPAGDWFKGYFDELRITKTARYTQNFTPPTSPLPNSAPA